MVLLLGLILIGLMIAYGLKDSVQNDYVFFCLVFMLLFYILPAALISSNASVYYAYRIWNFSPNDINLITGGFVTFLLGFFLAEYLIHHWEGLSRVRGSARRARQHRKIRPVHSSVLIGIFAVLTVILLYMILSDYTTTMYLIRSGQVEGNYFISLMLAACLVTTIFCMAELEDSRSLLRFVPIVLVMGFALQLGGRTTLLFTLAYIGVMFGLNLKRAVTIALVFFPVILPLIRDGKTLIYFIANGLPLSGYEFTFVFSYTSFTELYFDTIITNFAHPVISLTTAPLLVDSIGFRYFYDYLQGFLFYARVLGIDAGDSLTYMNTEMILGVRRSTVPTGYLAFGYAQLSFVGVFVSGCFYRTLGFAALRFLDLTKRSSNVLRFHITLICAYSFYTGEIRTMVITVFFPVLVIKTLQKLGRI